MFDIFGKGKKRIYLDYAAATPLRPEAARAMRETEALAGNPGALHKEGVTAADALARSRAKVARTLGCRAHEVAFVSGGTEANSLAILGFFKHAVLAGAKPAELHWITSSIEHPSVLACFEHIAAMGAQVTFVDPDASGRIPPERIRDALRPETIFVSIGWANSEIGTVQPLSAIAKVLHANEGESDIVFHSDAGQAPLYVASQVQGLGVDMLSLDSGKFYGPRGIGALYVREGTPLSPIILGGSQERGVRAGTENVALAAGFAEACALAQAERKEEGERLRPLKDELFRLLSGPGAVLNGSEKPQRCLPHILNVSFPHADSEYLVLALDHEGVACATKSACREGEESESHVVRALGDADDMPAAERAQHSVRFSLGRDTTKDDIRYAAEACSRILSTLRSF